MANDDLDKALESIRKGVEGIAKSSPVVAAGDAIASVGDFVIRHTPPAVKKAGRKLRRGLTQSQRTRRHQATRRKARRMRDGT